ncbi:MAG: hypothetical protein AAGJ35_09225, partial [Myxococcota bacterium]
MQSLFLGLARRSLRFPRWTLGIALILSGVLGIFAWKLPLRNDFMALLPESSIERRALRQLLQVKEGLGIQAVLVRSQDRRKNSAFLHALRLRLLSFVQRNKTANPARTMAFVARERAYLKRHPNPYLERLLKARAQHKTHPPLVLYAYHRLPARFFEPYALLFLSPVELKQLDQALRQRVRRAMRQRNDAMNLMEDDDEPSEQPPRDAITRLKKRAHQRKVPYVLEVEQNKQWHSALVVHPAGNASNLQFGQRLMSVLRQEVKTLLARQDFAGLHVTYSGAFDAAVQEYQGVKRELLRSFLSTALLLGLLLVFYFRQMHALWWIGMPLGAGLLWTMGLT